MSGQAFRWREVEPDCWVGVDGPFVYAVDAAEPGLLKVESNAGEAEFRSLFRLDQRLADIAAELLRAGPELEPHLRRFSGLRIMRQSCALETAISFLCTANNHMNRIVPMVDVLASFGEPLLTHRGQQIRRFPTLEVVAGLDEQKLRERGFGYRAATIPKAASQMLERGGEAWLASLRSMPYEAAVRELVAIAGIGPKLADCIALFGLHHTEAVPVDTHVWQAAVREYFPEFAGRAVTPARYAAVAEHLRVKFGPLAGWAQQMMFFDNFERHRARSGK